MEMDELNTIVTWLFSRKRRATYGAIAGLLGRTPRDLMRGRPRSKQHSWVVALKDRNEIHTRPDGTPFEKSRSRAGWPTGYKHHQIDRACYLPARDNLDNVIRDKAELSQWLDRRRCIASRIKHPGMRRLYERGDHSQVESDLLEKVDQFLAILDYATAAQDFDIPGFHLHQLEGDLKGYWAVELNGNCRIISASKGLTRSILN